MNEAVKQEAAKKNIYRLPSMDGLRFLMCLGIACLHFSIYFFPGDGDGHNLTSRFDYFNDIFFLLSGFLIARSNIAYPVSLKNYKTYMLMRFARIYPLYFATLLFFIMIAVAHNQGYITPDNPDRYDLNKVLSHILLIQSWGWSESLIFNYPTWALSSLWLMYIIFPLIFILANKSKILLITVAILFLLLGEFVANNFCQDNLTVTTIQKCNIGILRCVPIFILGVSLAYLKDVNISKYSSYILLLIVTILLFFTPIFWESIPRVIMIYAFVYCILNIDYKGLKNPLSWAKFETLAAYSYAIFLVHPIIATVYISYLLPRIFNLEILYASEYSIIIRLSLFASSIILSFFAAVVAYYIIEKPAYSFAKSIIEKKSQTKNPIWRMKK